MDQSTKVSPGSHSRSHSFPLTPPATVEKPSCDEIDETRTIKDIKPRKLFTKLRKNTRKPKLKHRPESGTVFDLDQYMNGLCGKKDAMNAAFVRYAFQHSKRIVVVIGAGVSVAAGIPDFRSSKGLFSILKGKHFSTGKDLFDFNKVYSSDEMSIAFNSMITKLHKMSSEAKPTQFHELLNRVSLEGRLQRLYTQNIDGLDTRLNDLQTRVPLEKPIPSTIQLHGSINHMVCNKCAKIAQLDPTIFKNELCDEENSTIIPTCRQCEEFESVREIAGLRLKGIGKLRPRVVLYNEIHPEGDIIGEVTGTDLKKKPDCLIIAGTSLKIPGVKNICRQFAQKVKSSNGIVLYMNKEMPSQSMIDHIGCVDLILLGDCQNVPQLLQDSTESF